MKKLFLITLLVLPIFLLSNFNTKTNKYPGDLPDGYAEMFTKEYIKTIKSNTLNTLLENNFKSLFDEVNSVHAQYHEAKGFYYYIVFGKKDGMDKIDMLKVHKSDVENNTYTYIDFSKIDTSGELTFCRRPFVSPIDPPFPPVGCKDGCSDDGCDGIICGVPVGGGRCLVF